MKPIFKRTDTKVSLPPIVTILLAALPLSLGGCLTGNFAERGIEREKEIQAIHDRVEDHPTLPQPIESLEIPDAPQEPEEEPVVEESLLPTIPIEAFEMEREADIAVVLRSLARGADLNIVLGRDVSGPIRISIPQKTTWDRLFKMIVETHSLHYEFRDDMLRVMSQQDIERQSSLERAVKERELAREERQRAEPLELELYRVRYAAVTKLAESIKNSFLSTTPSQDLQISGRERRTDFSIIPDEDSGILVLNATPTQMPRLLKLAENLDQPAYQILIEAAIVQANSETARQLGVQWGASHTAPDGGQVTIGTAANPSGFNSNFPAGFDPASTGFTFRS